MNANQKQKLTRQKLNEAWVLEREKDLADKRTAQVRQREEMAAIQARTQAHVNTLPQEIERQKAEKLGVWAWMPD